MTTSAREATQTEAEPSPRKVKRRAEQLVREAQLLLKKKGKKVEEPARVETRARLDDTIAKIPSRKNKIALDPKALGRAAMDLDQALAKHFLRWRKSPLRELLEAVAWAVGLAFVIRFFLLEAFSIPSSSMYPTLEIGDHLFINKIGYGIYLPFSTKRLVSWSQPSRGDIIVFEYKFPGDPLDGEDFIKRVIGLPGDHVRLENDRLIINGKPVQTEVVAEKSCDIFPHNDYAEKPIGTCPCVQQRESIDGASWVTQHLTQPGCGVGDLEPLLSNWPLAEPNWDGTSVLETNGAKVLMGPGSPPYQPHYMGGKATNPDFPDVVVPEGHVFVMGDNRDQSQDGRFWGFVPFNRIKGQAFVIWWARDKSRLFNWIN